MAKMLCYGRILRTDIMDGHMYGRMDRETCQLKYHFRFGRGVSFFTDPLVNLSLIVHILLSTSDPLPLRNFL